ncbi:hypothetical protein CcaverHIS641_0312370 [Cutaneotrichosporon cavernicola]|nr:hypothetical protein CcaverHIS641_0312370 [Cutaneotrichosporon cavernicola]
MEVPLYHHTVRVYSSPSTECLLQRPGGPRFATQETDPFGDPYLVGVQVGFRRRSLGTRPAWDDSEEAPAPTGRRWSVAALEVGRKARNSLRRASHGSPLSGSPLASERERSLSLSTQAPSASASPKFASSPLPCQPEVVEDMVTAQAQEPLSRRRGSLHKWLRHEKRETKPA